MEVDLTVSERQKDALSYVHLVRHLSGFLHDNF